VNVCASRRHEFVSLSWSLRLSPCWRYWEDWLDLILFETTLAGLVFSEVCYRIKWGEKNRSKNEALDGHNTERDASPFWPLFVFVSAFIALSFGGKQQKVVDIVSRSLLHDPVAEPVDLFTTLQTQIFELKTGYMVSHSERSPERCCRMGFTGTCDSRTARQEAESLWDRPVIRVFKGSKQLPINKGHLLCLCDKYGVKYWYDPVTNLAV